LLEPITAGASEVIHAHAEHEAVHSASLEIGLTVLSSLIGLLGIGVAIYFFVSTWPNASGRLASRLYPLYQISRGAWFFDMAYNAVFGAGTRLVGRLAVWVDNFIIDGILHTTSRVARELSRGVRRFQMGQVQAYALVILLGANILLLVILLW
jgi:NADH:ubiquinone oxidoreductase subunit 5 (subunit L)/multisubunit Na+/H+ antiporter MnhA subunit